MGNALREDESTWTLTVVDSKILKWSSNAIKWPVCFLSIHRDRSPHRFFS